MQVQIDEVERNLMKAMSLGLIKGVIDEVDQTIQVTWVMPRVLDEPRLNVLEGRLENWEKEVDALINLVTDQCSEDMLNS